MRSKPTGIGALVLLILLTGTPAPAFVLQADMANGQLTHPRWESGWMPISFLLNDRPFELLPNIAGGSMPRDAIEAAMRAWSIGPVGLSLDGTITNAFSGFDGVNLITFADTSQNRAEVGSGVSSVDYWYVQAGSRTRITEADIVMSSRAPFATDGRASAYDIQSRMMRALGYSLGLDETPVASNVMYAFDHLGKAIRRTLSTDDVAGLRVLYGIPPDPDDGTIIGQVVTDSGQPVFGAYVNALDARGIVQVGALSGPDGRFTIPSLPAGDYQVYAEPLDGPMTPADLSPGYQSIRHNFRTGFAGGNLIPSAVRVNAGGTTALDPIRVIAKAATIKVAAISWSPDGHSFSPAYPQSLPIHPGQSASLELTGAGLDQVDPSGFAISGSGLEFDPKTLTRGTTSAGAPFVILQVTAHPDAPLGPRSLYATHGDERAVLSGGVEVVAP